MEPTLVPIAPDSLAEQQVPNTMPCPPPTSIDPVTFDLASDALDWDDE